MAHSRFEKIDSAVDENFRFLETDFGYEPCPSEGTSHARHAYLKRYRHTNYEVRVVLFDWDVQTKHWNVFFWHDDQSIRKNGTTEQSIFTIAERLGINLPMHDSGRDFIKQILTKPDSQRTR